MCSQFSNIWCMGFVNSNLFVFSIPFEFVTFNLTIVRFKFLAGTSRIAIRVQFYFIFVYFLILFLLHFIFPFFLFNFVK